MLNKKSKIFGDKSSSSRTKLIKKNNLQKVKSLEKPKSGYDYLSQYNALIKTRAGGYVNQKPMSFIPTILNTTTEQYNIYNIKWKSLIPPNAPFTDWWWCTISETGQYQSAVVYNGGIWTSNDYGITWNISNAPTSTWERITISASGKYQIASSDSGPYYSRNYGKDWFSIPVNWFGYSAMSSSGQYQTLVFSAGYILTTSNYGYIWYYNEYAYYNIGTLSWTGIAISSSGQYQSVIVSNGGIWISNDYGSTWNNSNAPNHYWLSIAMSGTGQYQSAQCLSGLYTSNDYGRTWTPYTTKNIGGQSISISYSGQYQVTVRHPELNDDNIYISNDYGKTWINANTPPNTSWYSISISSSGQYITAVPYNTPCPLYTTKLDIL